MLILLGTRTIRKMYYANPSDRDDCYQTGMMVMFTNWRGFDPCRGNAFAYFTEVFKRAIARGWNELYAHKGDAERTCRTISLNTGNDGGEMFGF